MKFLVGENVVHKASDAHPIKGVIINVRGETVTFKTEEGTLWRVAGNRLQANWAMNQQQLSLNHSTVLPNLTEQYASQGS